MLCKWGLDDCLNFEEKCYLCSSNGFHYQEPKQKKKGGLNRSAAKASKRMGSSFELVNHNKNADLLSGASSRMTPNSGAGKVKGDEEIRGIINIMEELKQQNKTLARGGKTFSIQKEWLDKIKREAMAANKEFWYLKFSYADDNECFVVMSEDMCMSMVHTMVEDRKKVTKAEIKADIAEKSRRLLEAENVKLHAEIELLKAKLKLQELEDGANI